jgi:hypothetical protein
MMSGTPGVPRGGSPGPRSAAPSPNDRALDDFREDPALQYRTEVFIPPDRYVCLQLPEYLPQGRATITIQVHEQEPVPSVAGPETDLDRQDIEWWDEFEEDREPLGD